MLPFAMDMYIYTISFGCCTGLAFNYIKIAILHKPKALPPFLPITHVTVGLRKTLFGGILTPPVR